jgi:hypothetical protein
MPGYSGLSVVYRVRVGEVGWMPPLIRLGEMARTIYNARPDERTWDSRHRGEPRDFAAWL